ncbi:MAG TPA: cytochrome c3 family protein [Steroidobacteraceae bacterium]|nr:cytochrome c3 family protein [Steroidobacteraceae bacterium]
MRPLAALRIVLFVLFAVGVSPVWAAGVPAAPAAAAAAATPAAAATTAAPAPAPAASALPSSRCLDCHANGALGAPRVQPATLAHSVHRGLQCADCHSTIRSLPHPAILPAVNCASCHGLEGRELAQGHHARASQAAAAGAAAAGTSTPTCVDCHGSHAVQPVGSASFRDTIISTCGACHTQPYRGYLLTTHGQAALLGDQAAPRCSDCHDPHAARSPASPLSQVSSVNLLMTCGACHSGATRAFTDFDPHPAPLDPARSRLVYAVQLFMIALLVGVFGFFGLHTLLWLQRSVVGKLRGELPAPAGRAGPYVRRFRPVDRATHIVVIVSFMLLALTGLPLLYADAPWAPWLIHAFGGVHTAHLIHLANAAITFGYFLFHLCYLAWRILVKKQTFRVFDPDSLVPRWRDLVDIGRNFRWFLYLGPRPQLDRWTYWEKFDYWAVFWGVAIIGLSGVLLAFPVATTQLLPGVSLNVALVVHGEEALLATGFIFIFHFFHNHLRPENFPIDVTVFTGRVALERFQEERPLQYRRLLEQGQLQSVLVGPPSRFATVVSILFGYAVVLTGLALVVLMIVSTRA